MNSKRFFTLNEKQFLLRVLAYVYERIEKKQELIEDIFYLEGVTNDNLDLILRISSKLMRYNTDVSDLNIEEIQKYFNEDLTKEDIKKNIRGGLKMGKVKRISRKYFDFNKDGKVNFEDFVDMLKEKVDTDENGHIDVEELGKAVIDTVEIVQTVKGI